MKIIKEADDKKNEKEQPKREFMTDLEKKIQRKIVSLLRDDGKGHHHAKYAARLEDFILKIVPRASKPRFVAAVSWDNVTIYVSDGFAITTDADVFYQLSVLMRHELAHYILQHDIRMAQYLSQKYGDVYYQHFKESNLLHQTLNIIMDLEISNRIYKQEDDKDIVRTLHDSSRYLPGLVTDDIAKNLLNMKLPEMYEAVEKEIKDIKQSILASWDALDLKSLTEPFNKQAYIKNHIINDLHVYTDTKHPTNFFGTLDKYIQTDNVPYHFAPYDDGNSICLVRFSSLPELYQKIIVAINNEFNNQNNYTKQDLRDLVIDIAKTSPVEPFTIKSKKGKDIIKVYNPEEKFLAIDCLKAKIPELEEYQTWYDKVQKVLSDSKYSDADRQKIFDAINQ